MADPNATGGALFTRPDAPHRVHDLLLVAAYAAGDVMPDERRRAEALVAACAECRGLYDDLLAIQVATAALPAPTRTRDFRLTPEQAARARPQGVRRLVVAATHSRWSRSQPIAAGLTMLGLAGILATSVSFGSAGAAPVLETTGRDTAAPAHQAPTEPAPAASQDDTILTGPAGGGGAAGGPDASNELDIQAEPSPADVIQQAPPPAEPTAAVPREAITLASVAMLALGLGWFVVARRQRQPFD